MIGVYKENIKDIPCLVVVDSQKLHEPLPTLTYFHGFTSAKEHNLPMAYLLAEKDFRVILPDSAYHGERSEGITHGEMQLLFWDIVMQNVRELKDIYDTYQHAGLVSEDRFGVSGTSMGGITTAAALTQYQWIKTAAILMGTPNLTQYAKELVAQMSKHTEIPLAEEKINAIYEQLEQYDLSMNMKALHKRPLLFWHGKKDDVVPYVHSFDFYRNAAAIYENKESLQFISEENQSHKVSRNAILKTVQWFVRHLAQE